MKRASFIVIASMILAALLLFGCASNSSSLPSSNSSSADANSTSVNSSPEIVDYHGLSYTTPEGFKASGQKDDNDEIMYTKANSGFYTVKYYKNAGSDSIDPGVFEERNGLVEVNDDTQSAATIERVTNQGHKALKLTIGASVAYVVMIGENEVAFNFTPGPQSDGEFDDLITSIIFQDQETTAISPEEWDQTIYVRDIAAEQAAAKAEEERAKEAAEKQEREAKQKATHSAGSYKVGSDIPAGEYKLTATSGKGYYCVYPSTAKEDILENDNFSSVDYITVEDGQYIELSRCSMVEIGYATATTSPSGNGMYKVGFDIPAGEYKLNSSNGRGYYCIYDNSTVNRDILQNDNFEGSTYCVVSDGQYLVISRATIG